jgi:hypothetical protein
MMPFTVRWQLEVGFRAMALQYARLCEKSPRYRPDAFLFAVALAQVVKPATRRDTPHFANRARVPLRVSGITLLEVASEMPSLRATSRRCAPSGTLRGKTPGKPPQRAMAIVSM